MTSKVSAGKKISWDRRVPNLSPKLSYGSKISKARQALQNQSFREILTASPVLKKVKKVLKRPLSPLKTAEMTKGHLKDKPVSKKFVYGNQKPSILATMALSSDGRCGLTAGKLGKKAGRDMLKVYRPGQYLEQIIKSTKSKAKEVEKIKQSHKAIAKRSDTVNEETVKRRIIGDTKKK